MRRTTPPTPRRTRPSCSRCRTTSTGELAALPENQRALVTCEGAFSYLARDAGSHRGLHLGRQRRAAGDSAADRRSDRVRRRQRRARRVLRIDRLGQSDAAGGRGDRRGRSAGRSTSTPSPSPTARCPPTSISSGTTPTSSSRASPGADHDARSTCGTSPSATATCSRSTASRSRSSRAGDRSHRHERLGEVDAVQDDHRAACVPITGTVRLNGADPRIRAPPAG